MKKLFGTDGIRGVANQDPMTSELALSLGRALVHLFRKHSRPKILIGKDTRLSGYMIETALASGICSMGGDALFVGPIPTPGIAFLTKGMRADVGVVISASHNPFQDNGIKVFCRHGFKLPDSYERKIEELIFSNAIHAERPTGESIGKATRIDDAAGRYIEFVKSTFPVDLSLEGIRMVVDCAHGASYKIAPTVFEELGAEVITMGVKPDGLNINKACGAVAPKAMAQKVREVGAQIGIALDGDGDRVIFADENGVIVDGDAVLALCAEELIATGKLKKNTVVATVMSNQGIDEYLEKSGGKVLRSQVGDRYVVEMMRDKNLNFGGENSGHIVFLDHATTGDGMVAALQVLAIIGRREKPLSELVSGYHAYPQVLQSVRVKERKDLGTLTEFQKMLKDCEKTLGKRGQVLVRYSGTEPVIRVMIQGKEDAIIAKMAGDLVACLQKNLV